MLSNLASYIFGGQEEVEENVNATGFVENLDGEDEWVVVDESRRYGGGANHINVSDFGRVPTLASFSVGRSRDPSIASTISIMENDGVGSEQQLVFYGPEPRPQHLARSGRRACLPFGSVSPSSHKVGGLAVIKSAKRGQRAAKSSEESKVKSKSKKIRNIASFNASKKTAHARNLTLKSSGRNKQLKQC